MTLRDHVEYEEAVGAYVLDALPELEAEVFERHMLRCDTCREQVERLQPSVDALPRAVSQRPAPPDLKTRLMREVREEAAAEDAAARRRSPRRAWRPSLAWSAALASAVIVGFAAYGVFQLAQGSSNKTISAMVDSHRLAGAAAAKLEVLDDGDAAILHVTGLPSPGPGRVYQVWLDRKGAKVPTDALFSVSSAGHATVDVPGDLKGVDAVLVTDEPIGGSKIPTRAPVITASLT